MPNAYFYSNTAIQTTLSGNISGAATSIGVAATTGFPASFPYVIALDYGAATEELVVVTAAGGTTLTVTRGFGGTSAQSHSLGAVVRHVYNAQDSTDFRTHEAATTGVHGVAGALVGTTQTQTLTNKTLTNPTINTPTVAGGGSLAGTFTGTPTFSGAVTLSGTPSVSNGAALSGTFTGAPTFSGNVAFSGAPTFSGAIAHSNLFAGSRGAATDPQFESRVTADASARWSVRADGQMAWGPGSGAADTNLYRAAADMLRTDDAFVVGGGLTVLGGTTWSAYTPTVGGAGSATWTTRSGYYYRIGKLVFLDIYLQVNGAGSGSSTVTVTAPSSIDRSLRQVMTVNIEGTGIAGVDGPANLMTFLGGSGAVFDRIRVADNGSMSGSDLVASSLITIQGWYREA